MKAGAIVLAVGTMLTVEQRDAYRSSLDAASSGVSADGRFVAFTSYSQLAPADTNNSSDVYVLDRARRHVTLENAETGRFTGDSSYPGISGDGRFVAFERAGVVLLHDRQDGVTTIVGPGSHPAIAENGQVLAFTASGFDRAAEADVNGEKSDIYLLNVRNGGTARRVSVDLTGLDPSLTASVTPRVSHDGRYVAFASKLQVPGSAGKTTEVFVRDTGRQITRRIGQGWEPSISGDGRFVAFVGLVNQLPHILLADLETGESRVITNSVRRGLANGRSAKPALSPDGRFVTFQSEANDLVDAEDFNLLWDVFLFDRTTGATKRISGDREEVWMAPSGAPSIDATGSVVAFSSRHPTDASDKRNDFDLYVATVGSGHQAAIAAISPSPAPGRVFSQGRIPGVRSPLAFVPAHRRAPYPD